MDPLLFADVARLLFSKELITEIQVTITKPRLKKYFGSNALEQMLSSFEPYIDLVEVESIVTICRDPNDDFLLGKRRCLMQRANGEKNLKRTDKPVTNYS